MLHLEVVISGWFVFDCYLFGWAGFSLLFAVDFDCSLFWLVFAWFLMLWCFV